MTDIDFQALRFSLSSNKTIKQQITIYIPITRKPSRAKLVKLAVYRLFVNVLDWSAVRFWQLKSTKLLNKHFKMSQSLSSLSFFPSDKSKQNRLYFIIKVLDLMFRSKLLLSKYKSHSVKSNFWYLSVSMAVFLLPNDMAWCPLSFSFVQVFISKFHLADSEITEKV